LAGTSLLEIIAEKRHKTGNVINCRQPFPFYSIAVVRDHQHQYKRLKSGNLMLSIDFQRLKNEMAMVYSALPSCRMITAGM
jgi:hypothetical protein